MNPEELVIYHTSFIHLSTHPSQSVPLKQSSHPYFHIYSSKHIHPYLDPSIFSSIFRSIHISIFMHLFILYHPSSHTPPPSFVLLPSLCNIALLVLLFKYGSVLSIRENMKNMSLQREITI